MIAERIAGSTTSLKGLADGSIVAGAACPTVSTGISACLFSFSINTGWPYSPALQGRPAVERERVGWDLQKPGSRGLRPMLISRAMHIDAARLWTWRAVISVLAVFCVLASLAGCGGEEARTSSSSGMELSSPPFDMTRRTQPTGIDVELARALAASLGKELVIRNTAFDGLIPALQTGKIDLILSSMTITPQRAESIDFSTPYLQTGICLLVNAGSDVHKSDDLDRPEAQGGSSRTARRVLLRTGNTSRRRSFCKSASRARACWKWCRAKRTRSSTISSRSSPTSAKNPRTTRAVLEPLRKEAWGVGSAKGNADLLQQVNAFLADFRAPSRPGDHRRQVPPTPTGKRLRQWATRFRSSHDP